MENRYILLDMRSLCIYVYYWSQILRICVNTSPLFQYYNTHSRFGCINLWFRDASTWLARLRVCRVASISSRFLTEFTRASCCYTAFRKLFREHGEGVLQQYSDGDKKGVVKSETRWMVFHACECPIPPTWFVPVVN